MIANAANSASSNNRFTLEEHFGRTHGSISGNIFNVTNNINYQYDNRNIITNKPKAPVPQYGYFNKKLSNFEKAPGFSNGFDSFRDTTQYMTRRQQNSLAHQTNVQNSLSKNKNVKLKPFSKAYLRAAKEHQRKGSKSPIQTNKIG